MARQIFVNLPVKDLERSKAFFTRLGFGFDAKFTDEKAACLVIEKNRIYSMLLTEPFSKTFTKKAVADASTAAASGGRQAREAKDHGFMYESAFEDPDGHIWELLHMRNEP